MITQQQLDQILTRNKNTQPLVDLFNKYFEKYEINTPNRIAGFLAQCGHESSDFTKLRENLNYSANGLLVTFKKYFPDTATAAKYQRKPEMIANRVYANRLGNGPESSGDGWKYRGRGAIQLTGKNNYASFAAYIGKTLEEVVPYLETLEGAVESACWFWKTNGLNAFCDKDDIEGMTKRINGGFNGLADRKQHYEKAKQIL